MRQTIQFEEKKGSQSVYEFKPFIKDVFLKGTASLDKDLVLTITPSDNLKKRRGKIIPWSTCVSPPRAIERKRRQVRDHALGVGIDV
jgi:hypothetical protein